MVRDSCSILENHGGWVDYCALKSGWLACDRALAQPNMRACQCSKWMKKFVNSICNLFLLYNDTYRVMWFLNRNWDGGTMIDCVIYYGLSLILVGCIGCWKRARPSRHQSGLFVLEERLRHDTAPLFPCELGGECYGMWWGRGAVYCLMLWCCILWCSVCRVVWILRFRDNQWGLFSMFVQPFPFAFIVWFFLFCGILYYS